MNFLEWANKYNLPPSAIYELQELFNVGGKIETEFYNKSETNLQNRVRLEAAELGFKFMRNNSGVGTRADGVPVRFGLGNESPKLNKVFKMGDLIGCRKRLITIDMVGTCIGQFVMREMKKGNWKYKGTPHEQAQLNAIKFINANGGDAMFCNSVGTL